MIPTALRAAAPLAALVLLLPPPAPESPRPAAAQSARQSPSPPREQGPAAGRGAGRPAPKDDDAPSPLPPPEPDLAVADRFFAICDYNQDGWVSYREASQALELDQVRFSAYDTAPRDGRITRDEFRTVYARTVRSLGSFRPPLPDPSLGESALLEPAEPLEPTGPVSRPTTVIELFGHAEARPNQEDIVPRPPLIRGPVPVFRRLDIDGSGAITEQDLRELLRPLQVPVRIRAVLASLDRDGDNAVSHEELVAALRGGARPAPRTR